MNIILEGCDGTGKTTLAKHLCETLGLVYWHESEPRAVGEYQTMLSYGNVLFDRFCFGQFVYNTADQRKMTMEELTQLVSEVFPATGTIVLYVDCKSDEIVNRLIARGEGKEEFREEMTRWVKNIRGTYQSVFRQCGARFIEINGTGGRYSE